MGAFAGSGRRAATICVAALALSAPMSGPLSAQRPVTVRIAADNDAFNFWMPPWERPDQEYTSGVRGVLEYPGRLGLWPWQIIPRTSGVFTHSVTHSVTHSFALGQAIYTGRVGPPGKSLVLAAPAVTRPNAGWLYVEGAERDSTPRTTTEISVAIGVTGTPALGGEMQRLFHSLGPEYNRPVDWTRQLPYEPGFVARYMRWDVLKTYGSGSRLRGALASELGGALGTILTEGVAGASASADFDLGTLPGNGASIHLIVTAGAKARLVARDEFLDGTLFRSSQSVTKEILVFARQASVGIRWRRLGIVYRANGLSRQYKDQPERSTWGTIETEWRFGR